MAQDLRTEPQDQSSTSPTPRRSLRGHPGRTKVLLLLLVLLVLSAFLITDSLIYRGRIVGGVRVGGIELGGSTPGEAARALREREAELAETPLRLTYRGRAFEATLGELGWTADRGATIRAAMAVGRRGMPWSRTWDRALGALGTITVPWVASFAPADVNAVVGRWEGRIGSPPREGSVRVVDGRVVTRAPRAGLGIDITSVLDAAAAVANGGDAGARALPVVREEPVTSAADVAVAAADAKRLLSGPVDVRVRSEELTVRPGELEPLVRTDVSSGADGGPLVLTLAPRGARSLLDPIAEDVTVPPRNADFRVAGGEIKIRPDRPGRTLDGELAAAGIVRAGLSRTRSARVRLAETPADFTQADAEALGVTDRISTFTTYFTPGEPRVINITLAAETLDGTILKPGEVFSLNAVLGPRTTEKGYVVAPVIANGQLQEEVGGGVSQLTTTTFNAAFFAGYPFLEYKAHSFYIDRYPMGREATLSWTYPDLSFRNDTPTPAFIHAAATATSVTVAIYGRRNGRTVKATSPVVIDETKAGFSVEVTRLIRKDEKTSREVFHTYYRNPAAEEPAKQRPAGDRQASGDSAAR